ncbi:MAG: cation diffusion facilitator family transporter [Reyranella sp.]|nr:cation diffusion facilitator family transporter [Reyranella sp.]
MSDKDPATGGAAAGHRGRLVVALSVTVAFAAIEVIGGLHAASLALLADAAHMLISASGLALVMIANQNAERRAMPVKAHGYGNAGVAIVLTGCAFFLLLVVCILYEAYQRSLSLPEVRGGLMLIIAMGSLIVNLGNMKLLAAESSPRPHGKRPWVSILHDMPGSLEVVVTAIIIVLTGWSLVDPIVGAAIGLYIIPRTWVLANRAIRLQS